MQMRFGGFVPRFVRAIGWWLSAPGALGTGLCLCLLCLPQRVLLSGSPATVVREGMGKEGWGGCLEWAAFAGLDWGEESPR